MYIPLKFGSLDNTDIISSEPKDYLGSSGKRLITSLSLKTIRRSKKHKKARYAITNVGLKDISNIINEFEKLPYDGYLQKRSKHELTDGYSYMARYLAKCMMILNWYVGPTRTQMTNTLYIIISKINTQRIPKCHIFSSGDSKSKVSTQMKSYCMSVLWTRVNQKSLSLMHAVQTRANQKAIIKVSI